MGEVSVLFVSVCAVSVVTIFEVSGICDVVARVFVSPLSTSGMLIVPPSLACLSSEIIGVNNVLFDKVCGVSVVAISFAGTVVEAGGLDATFSNFSSRLSVLCCNNWIGLDIFYDRLKIHHPIGQV